MAGNWRRVVRMTPMGLLPGEDPLVKQVGEVARALNAHADTLLAMLHDTTHGRDALLKVIDSHYTSLHRMHVLLGMCDEVLKNRIGSATQLSGFENPTEIRRWLG